MLGLLILGCDIFWLVGFLSDAVFYGVMVFGGFLVWVVFGCCKVWGWFQFLGAWFWVWFLFRFLLVSVGFLAFGCCGLLFLYWGVGWFGGLVFCSVFVILQSFAS